MGERSHDKKLVTLTERDQPPTAVLFQLAQQASGFTEGIDLYACLQPAKLPNDT